MRSRRRRRTRSAALGAAILLAALTLAAAYALTRPAAPAARGAAVAPPLPTVFVPIASDGDDLSDSVQIQQLDHPAFQFGTGGATLTVWVRAHDGGAPLDGARVWLTLAPRAFAPAAALVTATTDARGRATIAHLAPGQYMLAAACPYNGGNGHAGVSSRPYALSSRPLTVGNADTATASLILRPLTTATIPDTIAGRRGAARNAIVVELNGVYADTWLDDHTIDAPVVRGLAARGAVATQVWADYGWPLIDDTVLATGGYPSWRLFDPWPRLVPWGEQDGIDQATWYGQDGVPGVGAHDFWGQDSVFDVARRFGLATGWLGADARRPAHLNGAALTVVATLGPSAGWEDALAATIARLARERHGFLLYVDLAPPPAPRGEQETSPAAVGGRYQQLVALYDAFVGVLAGQLASRGLTGSTALLLTAGEAQAGQTDAANYYGPGPLGRGSSLHVPLILVGPGIARGQRRDRPVDADAVAPTVTALLGLPPPAGARAPALPLVPPALAALPPLSTVCPILASGTRVSDGKGNSGGAGRPRPQITPHLLRAYEKSLAWGSPGSAGFQPASGWPTPAGKMPALPGVSSPIPDLPRNSENSQAHAPATARPR